MRSKLSALFSAFVVMIGLVSISHQAHASLSAANAFATLKGNTTIDSGGAMHSQARSIYSLGGGMTSFKGKKVTFLAVDPPSFSAGCSGISWHFGGFSFISMDELRQLVEAISQAALGIAVDLAMQTLCPQCYAVMSKLRDMANMMRNAAADSCRAANAIGRVLANKLGAPETRQTVCSEGKSDSGETGGWLNASAGAMCSRIGKFNAFLQEKGNQILDFLGEQLGGNAKTPNKKLLDATYNVQYEILTALGFQDGLVKDLMLNYTGMTIYHPVPEKDCTGVFTQLKPTNVPNTGSTEEKILKGSEGSREVASGGKGGTRQAKTEAAGAETGINTCHAPPRLPGAVDIAKRIVCGFDPKRDMNKFIADFGSGNAPVDEATFLNSSSFAQMCGLKETPQNGATALKKEEENPSLYTCRKKENKRCLVPSEKTYRELVGDSSQYTGLGWMVLSALYQGVVDVSNDAPLKTETIALLNGSGYPLYRLINMAAVYPGMATELLNSYSSSISIQYSVDVLDKLARPGSAISAVETRAASNHIDYKAIMALRSELGSMFRDAAPFTNKVQSLLAEKRALVQTIINVNRALQAEVISQGMAGNANLAISIKQQVTSAQNNP